MSKHTLNDRYNDLDSVLLEIKSIGGDKSATFMNCILDELHRLGAKGFANKYVGRVDIPKDKDANGKFATDASVNKAKDLSKLYERLSYRTVQNFMIERGKVDVIKRVSIESFDTESVHVAQMSVKTGKYNKATKTTLRNVELKLCDAFGVNHTYEGLVNTLNHYRDQERMIQSITKIDIKNKKFDLSVSGFNPLYEDIKTGKLNRSQKLTFELYSNVLFYVNKDIILKLAREGKFDRGRYEVLIKKFNDYVKRLQREADVNFDGGSAYARLKILQEVIDNEKL